jgi:hypothetical protein
MPAISRPRIVLSPIMNAVAPLFALEETNLGECANKQPRWAGPVRRDFNVLRGKASKIAIEAIFGCPQEQANERPAASSVEAPVELHSLGVPR